MQILWTDDRRAWASSVFLSVLVQVPFAILSFLPRHEFGAFGPGIMFFLPSLALVRLFSVERLPLVITVIALQTAIVSIPIFWLTTRRNRSILSTVVRVLGFVGILVAATAWLVPIERRRDEGRVAIQAAGKNAVLGNIERVNRSLAFFKSKY